MHSGLLLVIIIFYFLFLFGISYLTSKDTSNEAFFSANKEAPWYLVAFGMIGTSLSGVTFISVPGQVGANGFSYLQLVMGYLLGYTVIATVLMPMYYKLNLISIYSYLEQRFGFWSYKTGAFFFLASRSIGSAVRLYLTANVLQFAIFDYFNIPFWVSVMLSILLIWVYTYKGGIKTIIWTDTLQTFFMLTSLGISIYLISQELHYDFNLLVKEVGNSQYAKLFFWDSTSKDFFFKQFFSGAFIAIVMTGLDQDMMQKNLTCRNIGDAQKNMFWFSIILFFVNALFMALGALLYIYASTKQIPLPNKPDELFPLLALHYFPPICGIVFILGIIAAAYSSADSALTALTTSFCIDFLDFEKRTDEISKQKTRHVVHIGFSIITFLIILLFKALDSPSVITAVFTIAGYTYGPLLGLYTFGLFTKLPVRDKLVPYICIASPLICFVVSTNSEAWLGGYKFGFELLILNGLLTFMGLGAIAQRKLATTYTKA